MHSAIPIMQRSSKSVASNAKNGEIMKKVDHNVKYSSSSGRSSNKRVDSPTKVRSSSESKKSSSSSSKESKRRSFSPDKKSRSRSKSRSRKEKKERKESGDEQLSLEQYAASLPMEAYDSWDFGKPKTFKRPKHTSKNNKAATTINRWMRGWWARLQYKIMLLQFKFEHKDLLTQRALAKIKDKHASKKEKVRKKLMEKHEKSLAKITKEERAAQEAQKLIQQLRDENKKLREKNQKVYDACVNLKHQNDRLENTTSVAEGNIDVLNKHAKQIKETHDKLVIVEPRYKASVSQLLDAVEMRRQYCATERQMKLMYVKCVGAIVDLAEDQLKDKGLLDEIVGYVLDTENADHEEPLPEKVNVSDPDDDNDDDSDIDAYSVHSYGS